MKNGTSKSQRARKPARKQAKPAKPTFDLPPLKKNQRATPEYAAAYEKYLLALREWLWALPEAQFDREIRKLSSRDLHSLTWLNTYENYQSGGPMREIA